ncbi:MAG: helix-turn-helix domain-containing protein [Ideonella sp.]|jgi:AraC family transcriptional regulator of adaptative response / DNA-3-methyladenine glycosylase II|nr:helix-turn-helix domain-containing protein [Ideonella sp.]
MPASLAVPAQTAPGLNKATTTTTLDESVAWQAFTSRDARFDGRLYVGVTTTGIYCRPVCRVRAPLRRHCRFFSSAARAEQAGYRPCLRCRPELAPGLARIDSPGTLATHALRLLDEAVTEGRDPAMTGIAGTLGVSDRHLRRIVAAAAGVSPIDYLTTRRLLLAKQLLTDTALPVTEVALASGFSSLRRFNAAFLARYRLNPSALRRVGHASTGVEPGLVVRLGYRPPYDHDGVLGFFARRQVSGVEEVEGLEIRRTVAWSAPTGARLTGWLSARFDPERHELELRIAPALVTVLGALVLRVRQALDLDADPALIEPALAGHPALARRTPGTRVPGSLVGFESAVRIILGQQVTVSAARTLTGRLVEALGEPVTTPWARLNRLFPSAAAIASAPADAIGRLGIVRVRAAALQAVAREVAEGRLSLAPSAPLQPTLEALVALPGIGPWTAQMIAMRALAWPDAFPAGDVAVMRALGLPDALQAERAAEDFRPWRSYAVMALWQALETTR